MMMYTSLNGAMDANDELAEARMRYRLLAETFEMEPKLRSQLNAQLERAKAEILRLRAMTTTSGDATKKSGKVVAFDVGRFRKSG